MQDRYYKTTEDRNAVTAVLGLTDKDGNAEKGITIACGDAYFQSDKFILIWANTVDENGENLFTVRFTDDDAVSEFSIFAETETKAVVFA